MEAGWGYAADYVVVRRVGKRTADAPLITLSSRGGPGLLVRWRADGGLDIGLPVKSSPDFVALEKAGIPIKLVLYPDQPAIHEQFERLRKIDPYPVSEMIDFERKREFIEGLTDAAIHRLTTDAIRYQLSESRDDSGNRWCRLNFVTDGDRAASRISATLEGFIEPRGWVSFSLVLGVHGIRDPVLFGLTVTGAQIIGDGFATSMAEAASFSNKEPVAEDDFTIFLFRQRDLEQLLVALKRPPFKIAFLWDLPDTVVVYDVNQSPSQESLASFFRCIGDASPTHNAGEEFKPFWRSR